MKHAAPLQPLYTVWGKTISRTAPLKEYPRPQMRRDAWTCLNGVWQYAINACGAPMPQQFDGKIVVPFSPESLLSGVQRQLQPGETLWYHRALPLSRPTGGQRILLHFGAVDQCCRVLCNGTEVAVHAGGYWPFSCDITDALQKDSNELVVAVTDDSQTGLEAYGKQTLHRGGIWYTAQSGIWQTVWCETVPAQSIRSLRITPLYAESAVEVQVFCEGGEARALSGTVSVQESGTIVATASFQAEQPVRLVIPQCKAWSPDSPFLYDLTVTLCPDDSEHDTVQSYFGMRAFGTARGADGKMRLTLNGTPILHNGLLDQGYWSDGLYTAPSDEAMVWELTQLKSLGFNMLRKHIKIEPLRWYYHCDRLGILVWQDFVSGGGPYQPLVIQVLPFAGVRLRDDRYRLFGRSDADGRAVFMRDMKRTVELLYNTVSLALWVPFNEGWGQFDARVTEHALRVLDSTRAIDHASGWHDQGGGDLQSYHIYYKRFHPRSDGSDRVLALTEFGGYSMPCKGHMASEKVFGYKVFEAGDALDDALQTLYEQDVLPACAMGLGAVVYTQVSDVEDEINGLFTYDRARCKPNAKRLQEINRRLREAFAAEIQTIDSYTKNDIM